MAKKVAKKKVQKKTSRTQTSGSKPSGVKGKVGMNTQEIWLAGLGAFALAQDEGAKLIKDGAKAIEGTGKKVVGEGAKLYDRLIREGNKVQTVGRKMAEEAAEDVREDVTGRVRKVRKGAQENWDRLEKVFEERVAKALGRLGVPTSDEIDALSAHVVKLSEQVERLSGAKAASKVTRTQPTASNKVAKKATGKKTTKKKVSKNPVASSARNRRSTPKQS